MADATGEPPPQFQILNPVPLARNRAIARSPPTQMELFSLIVIIGKDIWDFPRVFLYEHAAPKEGACPACQAASGEAGKGRRQEKAQGGGRGG